MKLRTIQTTILTSCLCACMIAFTGCSGRTGGQPGTSAGDSSTESIGEYSAESSETSSDDMPPESSSETQTGSSDHSSTFVEEVLLDHEYLETVEEEILYVRIYLHMDEEALRDEYNEIYPNIGDDPLHWYRFLRSRGEQMIKEFLPDYGIAYEEDKMLTSMARIRGEFAKSIVSEMLDDPRVALIWHILYDPPIVGF